MVRASGVRGYMRLMRELGVDPLPLLARYNIDAAALEDDDALLSLLAVTRLLEASAVATGCPDFGLRMSRGQDVTVLGPLAIAIRNAATVAQAMHDFSSYLFVHSPAMVLSLHENSTAVPYTTEVRFDIHLGSRQVQRQVLDLCVADIHNFMGALAGAQYDLKILALPHTPIAPVSVYQRFFAAPIRFASEYAALYVAPETLAVNLQAVDEKLRTLVVDYLDQNFPAPEHGVSARVRQALHATLGTPRYNKADIAALLAMHPRTLQRHLDAEGTQFLNLREEVRKDAAMRYLRETQLPLVQVAGILGLSEQSALARSCRRWFGTTPSALRHRQ